jgi:hypothetical protein
MSRRTFTVIPERTMVMQGPGEVVEDQYISGNRAHNGDTFYKIHDILKGARFQISLVVLVSLFVQWNGLKTKIL